MWGWDLGEGRSPIPMSHDEFSAKVKQWAASGAHCPNDRKDAHPVKMVF